MRLLKLLALSAALLLFGAVPAFAHVTVIGQGAVPGGDGALITFQVPTESDTASTTQLRVVLPTDTPLPSILVLQLPGWTETSTSVKLATPITTAQGNVTSAVSEIVWTAQPGYAIKPGSFGQFSLLTGTLPKTASLTFKAVQTYSDGKKVSWIQTPVPGLSADDLDYPAPVLALSATGSSNSDASVAVVAAAAPAKQTLQTVLAAIALALAVAACVVVVLTKRPARAGPVEPLS